ncbi:MAG: exodeoxyribonuclease VII large subunit [Cellvibrionales bacterium]|nr:exodeoxyribonuclease VII large subunit [Cellvibrionales bacterium]
MPNDLSDNDNQMTSLQANPTNGAPILSVNELNLFAKGTLEKHIGSVWVTGEISNFSRPASGHWYFTLKDNQAQIRCAMFRGRNMLIKKPIENGMQILVKGQVSLYTQRGDYQLIADYLEESGLGALQRQFELLKQKLHKEGLFDPTTKKAIPKHPAHIGIVTSSTGAAIEDMKRVLATRKMPLQITLIPTSVQGEQAPKEICQAIALANQWNTQKTNNPIDVLIVGRGGGSIEDLWAFNEETVARSIHQSKIPTISAVGHETDTTIADYVADSRAATPSVAAEMVTAERDQIAQQLDLLERQLKDKTLLTIHQLQHRLNGQKQRLKHPSHKINAKKQQLAQLNHRLERTITEINSLKNQRLIQLTQALNNFKPEKHLHFKKEQLTQNAEQLKHAMQHLLNERKQKLTHQGELLQSVSPLQTLNRGYAIAKNQANRIIQSPKDVSPSEKITIQLKEGIISARIK